MAAVASTRNHTSFEQHSLLSLLLRPCCLAFLSCWRSSCLQIKPINHSADACALEPRSLWSQTVRRSVRLSLMWLRSVWHDATLSFLPMIRWWLSIVGVGLMFHMGARMTAERLKAPHDLLYKRVVSFWQLVGSPLNLGWMSPIKGCAWWCNQVHSSHYA